ncbi:uncharacterized protein MELLADRAFT_123789 [Melampsora larici-populina 98AG31]|uniref:Secreted protein n=1 Tax=Melampsora larici-populina (strain 98AG31 / pathotype 3-4-7) TaxID=747676 RepID=F4SCI3_MELLP|nr:uncharacterized protein MELLADRAFT_123789 [Melampsora larici-populina 98AG31]EGF97644.1 secreted protein [Melampsora larici-populina 98AG31]
MSFLIFSIRINDPKVSGSEGEVGFECDIGFAIGKNNNAGHQWVEMTGCHLGPSDKGGSDQHCASYQYNASYQAHTCTNPENVTVHALIMILIMCPSQVACTECLEAR